MSFTYSSALTSNTHKVRFYIQDTKSGNGPRPESENFSDEEIAAIIEIEGSWQAAVAACFEALSAAWQDSPVFGVGELGTTHGRIAEGYAKQAEKWRERSASSSASTVGSSATLRKDAYSDDVDSLTFP